MGTQKYATCECGKTMSVGGGCRFTHYCNADGTKRIARKVNDSGCTCHECNAGTGKRHHLGCDMERCPVCGGQAIGCECLEAYPFMARHGRAKKAG